MPADGDIFKLHHSGTYTYSEKKWFRLNKGGIHEELKFDAGTLLKKQCVEAVRTFLGEQLQKHASNADNCKLISKSLTQSQKNQFMNNSVEMLQIAFIDEQFRKKLDTNLNLVGFNNGVYDLEADVFRTGKREDYVSLMTGYDYTPEENNNYFEGLVASIFEDSERAYWFKVRLGSLVVGGNPEESVDFWVGAGQNGKGTMDGLLRFALGTYYGDIQASYFTTPEHDPARARPDVLAFKNIRVGMTQEPASGEQQKWYMDKLKRVTGGDPLTGRELYGKKETFTPHHKQLVSTNHLPTFTDIDDGLRSRLRVVRFPLQFMDATNYNASNPQHRKQNGSLKKELDPKRPTFFNFLLKYYRIYKASGLPSLPKGMEDDLREYKEEIDTVKVFMDGAVVEDKDVKDVGTVFLNHLHQQFKQHDDINIQLFSSRLKKLGYVTKRKASPCGDGKKLTYIVGYRWKDEDEGYDSD